MSTEPCPQCGKPIADTAYLCFDCQQWLSSRLLFAAELWEHVQDTVGHLTHVEGVNPKRPVNRDVIGPLCKGRSCDHESCTSIWKTSSRWRNEPPSAREEKGLLDLDAFENAWIVGNTVAAWTSHVAGRRGNLAPTPEPAHLPHVDVDFEHIDRCLYSDLPIDQCACGHQHRIVA